jgi:hypothetical protein
MRVNFSKASRPGLGLTQLYIQWVLGALSPPASAEVKNEWCHTSTSPYAFMAYAGTTLPLPFTKTFFYHVKKCKRCWNQYDVVGSYRIKT